MIKDSFVVVSDFHSYRWPIDIIKSKYLDKYEKIYILGDITDRGEYDDGTGGLDLLFEIKSLVNLYSNRIIYIPGNHDVFFYSYAKNNDLFSKELLISNHGTQTIDDIDDYRLNHTQKLNELIDWLGKLPLQREHFFESQRYALAHAFFDQKVFEQNPDASLEDYINKGGYNGLMSNILWFRKKRSKYDFSTLPSTDTIMVIGHTPKQLRINKNLNLINEKGGRVKVYCVDGGITYGDDMLMFDGGDTVKKEKKYVQNNCGSDNKKLTIVINEDNNKKINNIIIKMFQTSMTLDEIYLTLELLMNNNFLAKKYLPDGLMREINTSFSSDLLKNIIYNYYNSNEITNDEYLNQLLIYYVNDVIFEYIVSSLVNKFGINNLAINQIYDYLFSNKLNYISDFDESINLILEKIPTQMLKKMLNDSGYSTLREYIYNRIGKCKIIKKN